jgi:hypothetical protein
MLVVEQQAFVLRVDVEKAGTQVRQLLYLHRAVVDEAARTPGRVDDAAYDAQSFRSVEFAFHHAVVASRAYDFSLGLLAGEQPKGSEKD